MRSSCLYGPLGHAKYEGYVRDIRQSSRHLLKLIDSLLELSKVEAGKVELHREQIDPVPLVEELRSSVELAGRTNGNELVMAVDPSVPAASTDRFRLSQIHLNMLSNACKFTSAGTANDKGSGRKGGWQTRLNSV